MDSGEIIRRLGLFIGLLSTLAGIYATPIQDNLERVLRFLSRSRLFVFIGREEVRKTRAIMKSDKDGTNRFESTGKVYGVGTSYVISVGPRSPSHYIEEMRSGDETFYGIVETTQIDAPAKVYLPIFVLTVLCIVSALIIEPRLLIQPFLLWVRTANTWASTDLAFPSIPLKPVVGFLYLIAAFFASVAYVSLLTAPPTRVFAAAATFLANRGSLVAHRALTASLAVAGFLVGAT